MFTGHSVKNIYMRVQQDVAKGKVDEMAELHYITSGLKSVVTHLCGEATSQARMSCGGHGYSKASNIPELYGVAIGGCTYEGENMVMLQQLARYLMRAAKAAKSGKALSPLVEYLVKPHENHSLIDKDPKIVSKGLSQEEAWNQNAVELNRVGADALLSQPSILYDKTFKHILCP
ncbi:hypothetical protein OESDEN_21050 [Oesophagostomum dentatum]|uniref:Acyl-CoA oxidase C-alpha1 domain-containing protein n=1 Tax=Oesophagostomum dentatum TaxID=61180 RepID=A0A0B1S715_OESDE|nr:hypothetical protein OESDEN_21050 [Oesophagostomum dentatum]